MLNLSSSCSCVRMLPMTFSLHVANEMVLVKETNTNGVIVRVAMVRNVFMSGYQIEV